MISIFGYIAAVSGVVLVLSFFVSRVQEFEKYAKLIMIIALFVFGLSIVAYTVVNAIEKGQQQATEQQKLIMPQK